MLLLKFNSPKPWKRPEYHYSDKLIRPSSAADYQEDIRHNFIKTVNRQHKVTQFPTTSNVGMIIKLCTKRNDLKVGGVVKNILDALNGMAYYDDFLVTSFRVDIVEEAPESTTIILITGRDVSLDPVSDYLIDPYVLLSFKVESQISDSIIPTSVIGDPPRKTKDALNNETILLEEIRRQMLNRKAHPIQYDIGLRVMIKSRVKADIDNIVLQYLFAMCGLVFNDIRQIKSLYAYIDRESLLEECKIYIENYSS